MAVFAPAYLEAADAARLRRALLRSSDPSRFRDLPVDWLDPQLGNWRPTAVGQARRTGEAVTVDVLVPIDDGVGVAPAALEHLRLATGTSDAVTRFWTLRFRLRLLRTLAAALEPAEAAAADLAAGELAGAEAEMRDVWQTAFAHGLPPARRRTLLRPGQTRLVAEHRAEEEAMAGRCSTGPGGMLETALSLYGSELGRVHGVLREIGLGDAQVSLHPLSRTLACLIDAAAGELWRCRSNRSKGFDPELWSP